MRKVKLYIASSLNSKIAKPDGSVDWLDGVPNPKKLDYGYNHFYDLIDTTIMGYKTYEQIINWGIKFPYADKQTYVFTRKKNLENTQNITFITEFHINFVKNLKQQKGKDIWLVGGGKLNTMLFNENLIDEIQLFILPIVLEDGIDLFEKLPKEKNLILIESKQFSSGVVELKYKTEKN